MYLLAQADQPHTLNWLDGGVIVAYFAVLAAIGAYFGSKQKSAEGYFVGERNLPWFAVGISVMATLISSLTYLALPSEMIGYGTGYFYSMIGSILAVPIINAFIIPALMRLPVTSVYEYFEKRFGVSARLLSAMVFIATRLVWLGLIDFSVSLAVSQMTGWNLTWLIVGIGVITAGYTIAGGIAAVIWTDFVQGVVLLGGALLIPCYIAWQTQSTPDQWWTTFAKAGRNDAPLISLDLTQMTIMSAILYSFVWNLCTHGADQVAAQRYLTTSSAKAARRSVWVYTFTVTLLIVFLMIVGLAVFHFRFEQMQLPLDQFSAAMTKNSDNEFPAFIVNELPHGFPGLLVAALLAAAMSSISSGINSITTVITTDLLDRGQGVTVKQRSLASVRAISLAVSVAGIGVALGVAFIKVQIPHWNLVSLMSRVNELFVAPLGAIFLAGVVMRRVGQTAALLGFAAGALMCVVTSFSAAWVAAAKQMPALEPFVRKGDSISFSYIIASGLVASLLVSWLASFFCAKPTPEQLVGLTADVPSVDNGRKAI